uniref:Uncharacterized protein n=2 Tax=Arundo donax TaxID=35708 RepID=A0A0A8XMV1_ARUDO
MSHLNWKVKEDEDFYSDLFVMLKCRSLLILMFILNRGTLIVHAHREKITLYRCPVKEECSTGVNNCEKVNSLEAFSCSICKCIFDFHHVDLSPMLMYLTS